MRDFYKQNFSSCNKFSVKRNHDTEKNIYGTRLIAHINKIVLNWCRDICSNVVPSFGTLTAYLRDKFLILFLKYS